MVMINTGWHHRYSDSMVYFGHGPGLSGAAARWLVDREVKLVGIDTATVDHPMATSLAGHRGGPIVKELPRQYRAATGHDPEQDHPDWNIAHKTLLEAGIPTIENVGGNVDAVDGTALRLPRLPLVLARGRRLRHAADGDPRSGRELPARRRWLR